MPATTTRPKLKPVYPRPPLTHDHAALFREPQYKDGQTYPVDDEEDDDGPAIITA